MADDDPRKKRRVDATPSGATSGAAAFPVTPRAGMKTPGKAWLRRDSMRRSIMPESDPTPLAPPPQEIMNTSWMVYRVSPLYKFSHDTKSLQTYSKLLSASLEAEKFKGTGVAVQLPASEQAYAVGSARLSVLPNLALYEGEAEAIHIVVNKQQSTTPILKAILCSVGSDDQKEPPFVSLPVLLVKGAAVLSQQVISWLSRQFDCKVTKLHFPPKDLVWMATEWAAPEASAPKPVQRPLALTYKPPSLCKSLSNISYTIETEAIRSLQDMLRTLNDGVVSDKMLFDALEEHFMQHFNIKLSTMTLIRVGTYAGFFGAEGRIKLLPLAKHSTEDTHLVLQYVTYMATRNVLL